MSIGEHTEAILDASTIDAIRTSTRATCVLLDPYSHFRSPVALTSPRELTLEGCSLLKTLLLDSQSWFFACKRCLPRPTALFRLMGGNAAVLVSVDTCVGWVVTGPEQRHSGFFDPVHDQVRGLLKSTFSEFASPNRQSMWIAGAIAGLRAETKSNGTVMADESRTYVGQPRGK
jgi:hypothetical protein